MAFGNFRTRSSPHFIYLDMTLNPKTKLRIKQILPFAFFWFLFSLIYSLVEYGLLGTLDHYPSTGVAYDFKDNISFTVIASTFIGLIQGWIEVSWLRKRFINHALWVKIFFKTVFYLFFVVFFLSGLGTLNGLINHTEGDWVMAIEELMKFVNNFVFWSIMIFISVTMGMAILISEISLYLGGGVLYNFFFGKYHKPKQETRIFMFLDMKSSTTIAEKIGHSKYFELLKAYYGDMTDAILESSGEIYQYVGDEIVISWPKKAGIYNNNCIHCYVKISKRIDQKSKSYLKEFGLVPEFKAGYHIGEVTTGEIGILKKDIIYTGDVLNTAARIQAKCNEFDAEAILSEELLKELQQKDSITFDPIGNLKLRGKQEEMQLHKIIFE